MFQLIYPYLGQIVPREWYIPKAAQDPRKAIYIGKPVEPGNDRSLPIQIHNVKITESEFWQACTGRSFCETVQIGFPVRMIKK